LKVEAQFQRALRGLLRSAGSCGFSRCICHILKRHKGEIDELQHHANAITAIANAATPLERQGWNHAEIARRDCIRMVAQECTPVLDGGPRCRIMYLQTVDSAISNPSFSSSPWHPFDACPRRALVAPTDVAVDHLCQLVAQLIQFVRMG
jgi:hypothetical protein